ncbi:MAG: APC family permease [Candidatus Jordarchaeaceae archaeon]
MVSNDTSFHLKKNVGSLWLGVFQSLAFVAPAATAASFYVVEAGVVGAALPLTYIIAVIGVLSAMYMNYSFSRRISHAGGYYAYVSSGFGPRAGIFASWLYLFNLLGAVSGFSILFFAGVLWPIIPDLSTNPLGWIPLMMIPFIIITVLLLSGLKPSLYYTMIGGVLEVIFLVIISLVIIIKVGPSNSVIPFTTAGYSFSKLGLATVYAILGYVGVGSVITLSEEMKQPKKNVPKAIFIAIAMAALAYIMSTYAFTVGWGINNMSTFSTTSNPGFIVVEKYAGPVAMGIFILLTLNSFISNGIAEGNALSRTGFAMARDSIIFPKSFAKTGGKTGAPFKVIIVEMIIVFIIALVGGLIWGPFTAAAVITTMNGASLYVVHIIANFSLPVWGRRTLKMKLKEILPFALFPLAATLVYAFAVYGVFIPLPPYPLNISSYWVILIILTGIVIAFLWTRNRKKEDVEKIGKEVETFD